MPRHECPGGHFAGGTTMPTTSVLSLVRRMVLYGWQPQAGDGFRPYEQCKLELSV